MKNLVFLVLLLSLTACPGENVGPFESDFSGFWKLKETQNTNGKIDIPTTNQYFYREWYGSIGQYTTEGRDSIIFYNERVPVQKTAIITRVERNIKIRKAISLLYDNTYISLQFISNGTSSNSYLEVRRAKDIDKLNESPVEKYNRISMTREW